MQSSRLNGRTCQLCFFENCFCTVAALTTSAGLLGYYNVLSVSTVKHIAIMTPMPEMPETGVRFFPVTALLFDDLLHSLVRKSTMCFCFSTDRNNHL